jgi:transcriptional regulator with XRE-family HTH domain
MKTETLGQRLKRLREQAGLSQAKLSVAAGVPIGTIRAAEYDRRQPLFWTAAKIAHALGVSLDELTGHGGAEDGYGFAELTDRNSRPLSVISTTDQWERAPKVTSCRASSRVHARLRLACAAR